LAECCWCHRPLTVAEVETLRCWVCPVCYPRQLAHRLTLTVTAKHAKTLGVPSGKRCLNVPLPSQVLFEETSARNILWGGQAGPGKSHGVRWWLYQRSLTVKGHRALLLRETHHELEATHLRDMEAEVPLLGGIFRKGPPAEVYFPATGAYIDAGHMSDPAAVRRYLGTNYGAIVAEEGSIYPLTEYGVSPLGELSTRAREVFPSMQTGLPVPPVFIVASNPGGPSSSFLLDFFIDKSPDLSVYPQLRGKYKPENFVYLPARLEDNPYIKEDYEQDLALLPDWRYKQLREGDWRSFAGQFFSTFRESHHVKDLGTPEGAQWFRSMDWGYHAPGCVIWWAVLPDHRLYIRQDWKFQGLDEPDVAKEIQKIDRQLGIQKVSYTAADPAMWNKTGASHKHAGFVGRSIADTLSHYKVSLVKADHDRVNGWKRAQALLRDAPDGVPWLVLHPDATYLRRTIPAARSERGNPEDVDTTGDDHALDAWRYGAMSPAARRNDRPVKTYAKGSVGDLRDRALRETSKIRRFGRVA
jgi:phage terminase large subunit